jgi:dihydroxyacetone kinase DhaKLM complex PTS-EIIA-like component DhaM
MALLTPMSSFLPQSRSSLWAAAVVLASGMLISCAPSEVDKVGEAQLCIDNAQQGEAAACLQKISGVETAAANTLRCSAGFIDEGFTQPARFKSAFDQLSTGAASNTEGFLSVLSFKSKATADLNVAFSTETYGYCVKSGGKGVMLLASMATTATNLAKVAGTLTGNVGTDTTAITGAITTVLADPTSPANAPVVAAVGSAVASTYTSTCKSGQQADASLCTQLDAALVGKDLTDSAAIGLAVLTYWQNH